MTKEENLRYSRQISVTEIGESGQERLLYSKVAIIGCGALGTMVAMQLAAAGIGRILIADFDTIDISNLQRQFFFTTEDSGKAKTDILANRMNGINPGCEVEVLHKLMDKKTARVFFKGYDFIVDATDNPASKMMIEEICAELHKPCCIGGVTGFRGQIMTVKPGGVTFGEIFCPDKDADFMPCSIGGVMGPAAALCASIQAAETIKYLIGTGQPLENALLTFDLLTNSFQKIAY